MAKLNHTIVAARDADASALFSARGTTAEKPHPLIAEKVKGE